MQDKLITGTGSSAVSATFRGIPIGPRVYKVLVRQTETIRAEDEFESVYAFVGPTVDEEGLKEIRAAHNLSDNYGVVLMPKHCLRGVDASSKGIIGENKRGLEGEAFVVVGLLPTESLRQESIGRGYLLKNEYEVFATPENFPGLDID